MLHGKQALYRTSSWATIASLLMLFASCSVIPKNYPADKPFVYKTNIKLEGNFTTEEKNELVSKLSTQLDDSIRVRTVDKLLWSTLNNPPVYDSSNADRSIIYMRALLNSLGYFRDSISYDTVLDIHSKNPAPDQYRTTVNFTVIPGKQVKLDSINYKLSDSTDESIVLQDLQHLTDSARKESLLKTGEPFAKPAMSAELNRLVELYRNNGYLRFTQDELRIVWDTVDVALLRPATDPLEQIQLLTELQKRRENPTADIDIIVRPGFDSLKLRKYYVGNVTVYPDFDEDTVGYTPKETMIDGYKVISYRDIIKPKILPPNIYLARGALYRHRRYIRTINRFNTLSAWKLVNFEQFPRSGTDTVDLVLHLTPAEKYLFDANLEGSRNASVFAGNLLGIGINLGLQNRNFAKASDLATTNIRFGTELNISSGEQIVQSRQASISHNIYFPRSIPHFGFIPDRYRDNIQTVFSFALASTDRRFLYNLTSLNGSWGYEYKWRNKSLTVRFPNVEYSLITRRDSLEKLIRDNPSLANIFNDGLIISTISKFIVTGGTTGTNIFRVNFEESGLLTGMIRNSFFDKQLYRFIKADGEFSRSVKFTKKEFAFRLFAGAGYELSSTVNPDKQRYLPFFKQFYAGGPNSMRAWGLRRLGPGSAVKSFRSAPDRFGDVQLEANAEFRFPLFNYRGVQFNSALFVDAGNVWFLRKNPDFPNGEFNINRVLTDMAVGVGTGLRVDFNFFLLRVDYAFKAKNPSPAPEDIASQNKWFYDFSSKKLLGGQVQLGINYPF
jgi:outer membrane protein insertion porin family